MYGFYHHFRAKHVKIAYLCLRCLRTFDGWVVARDHSHSCQTTLTNRHLAKKHGLRIAALYYDIGGYEIAIEYIKNSESESDVASQHILNNCMKILYAKDLDFWLNILEANDNNVISSLSSRDMRYKRSNCSGIWIQIYTCLMKISMIKRAPQQFITSNNDFVCILVHISS